MTTALEVLQMIKGGETSHLQLKEDVKNATSIAQEIVAFANSEGGKIIIGVSDKTGEIIGLSFKDIQRINALLTTASQEHIKSALSIMTETIDVAGQMLIVATVPEGTNKPYLDKDGHIFIKNGADKRKVVSNDVLRRLLQSSGNLYAEETLLEQSEIGKHLDKDRFSEFFEKRYGNMPNWDELPRILENMRLAKKGKLTLTAALLFGLDVRYLLPSFYISAVWFKGNDLHGSEYLKSENLYGTLKSQFQQGFDFIYAKLEKTQNAQDFNSTGEAEIPKIVINELLINALIHRDYFIKDCIKLFVFDNRIEIRSPGVLPNNLNELQIRYGISKRRNELISMFSLDVLPYRGIGSGILRALQAYPDIDFLNDKDAEEFKVVIKRKPLV
jgi:ATP-dependent DNA helicase RecG